MRRGASNPSFVKRLSATKTLAKKFHNPPALEEEESLLGRMKLSGESLTKEPRERMDLQILRKISRIGTWNVRTMFQTGKTREVAKEFMTYKLDILGISETRWTGNGKNILNTGETVLYSGHEEEDARHSEGVGFMLSKKAAKALLEWEPAGPRIISARFRTNKKRINLHVINCYAPTNDKDEETKEQFYTRLQASLDKTKEKDITVLMGDFNAQIGDDNIGYTEIMGNEGIGRMNENGELFADMCANNKLVIGGSIFQHKRIHKATWVSPNYHTGAENQIDHICIKHTFRSSLQDVKVYRGADVGSDHHLVVAKIKLKLRKGKFTPNQRPKYNINLLSSKKNREEFAVAVNNRFQALETIEDAENIEEHWNRIKGAWRDSCEETLGLKVHQNKEWITENSLKKIEERKRAKAILNSSKTRTAKKTAQQKLTETDKAVKRSIKADKKKYLDDLAQEAEEAAERGNLREVYSITKRLAGKFQSGDKPIKDKQGKLLTSQEEQKNRWKEHFQELLNRPPPENPPEIEPASEDLEINLEPPSLKEIEAAIKKLRNNKAAGPDGIPGDIIKGSIDSSAKALKGLFHWVWTTEIFPQDWKEGHIVKLPKKGNLQQCGNHRGITLLSVPGKVFNRVILERLKNGLDTKLRDEQAGFRKGKSCADQIATLRIIVEQSLEWNSPLYINFIDFEKAFDSVDRESLWKLLRHFGVPQKLTDLISKMYENTTARVIHSGELSDAFDIRTGVRQGCLLSPFLFLLAVDYIMKRSTEGRNNGIQWTLVSQLNDLDFADDIALLSHNHRQMQEKTNILDRTSKSLGLKINKEKTKVLRLKTTNETAINVSEMALEDVNSFVYLGSTINKEGGVEEDVKQRIQKARKAFVGLRKIWQSKIFHERTKIRIFNSNVKSVLLYGSETWRTNKSTLRKLQSFNNRCLRQILNIHWPDTISNKALHTRTRQQPMELELRRRRWRWIGHTMRQPKDNIARKSLNWNPQGKRPRGRPPMTWKRQAEAELKQTGKTWQDLERVANDRRVWKDFVDGLCSTGS